MDDYTAYRRMINRIFQDIEQQNQKAIRRVIRMLHEARIRVIENLMTAEGRDLYHLALSGMLIERWLPYFEGRYRLELPTEQWRPYEWDTFLNEELRHKLERSLQLVDLSPYQLMVVQGYSIHPIHGLAGDALSKVNSALTLGILGQKTPFQIMQEITHILGEEELNAIGGISYRAETITRTELGRISSIAKFARLKEAAKVVPGLMKEWRAAIDDRTRGAHRAANMQRVPIGEPFVVGGEELMYPLDPVGSPENTLNCRCISVSYHPNWETSIRGVELPGGHVGIIRER